MATGGGTDDVRSLAPSNLGRRFLSAAAVVVVLNLIILGCNDGGGGKKRVAVTTTSFMRGDSNHDGRIEISDGIYTNNYLFLAGPEPVCLDAADADDSGFLGVSDPVFTWNYLFRDGPDIPEPFPDFGQDESPDELTCDSYLFSSDPGGEKDLE